MASSSAAASLGLGDWTQPALAQQVLEAPRAERLAVYARLKNIDVNAACLEVAQLAHVPLALEPKADPAAIPLLPSRLINDYQIVPMLGPKSTDASQLHLATVWPPDLEMQDWVSTLTPRRLCWHLAPADRVRQLIIENYGVGSGSLEESDDTLAGLAVELVPGQEADADAAVVRFVSDVIAQAIEDGATDIHFEPQEGQLRIRYRVDGLLVLVPVPDNLLRFQDAIISRLKIMARLNISEKRLPQDGRISFKTDGSTLDIRVSTIPTIHAESVSLRLLNQRR